MHIVWETVKSPFLHETETYDGVNVTKQTTEESDTEPTGSKEGNCQGAPIRWWFQRPSLGAASWMWQRETQTWFYMLQYWDKHSWIGCDGENWRQNR